MKWLYEFIKSVSLFYRCKFCSSVSKSTFNGSTNQTTDAQITSLPNNMMQLCNQMKFIQDRITEFSVNMNAKLSAFIPIIGMQVQQG